MDSFGSPLDQSSSSTPVVTPDLSAPMSTASNFESSSSSTNSQFFQFQRGLKRSPQLILGVLVLLFLTISGVAGFWLSNQQQDVRQQASVDVNLYGDKCMTPTPITCDCGLCGSSTADCNAKCGTSTPSNPPKSCPAGSSLLSGSTTICTCNLTVGSGTMTFSIDKALPSLCGQNPGSAAACSLASDRPNNCACSGDAICQSGFCYEGICDKVVEEKTETEYQTVE